jgi:hypothetical protein
VASFSSEIMWAVEIIFLLNVLSREWLSAFNTKISVILTESLLFETARSASLVHALDKRLDQIIDLGLVGHI